MEKILKMRFLGYGGSLICTLLAYFLFVKREFLHLSIPSVITIVFALALIQFTTQFFCFINMWKEKKPYWNMNIFLGMTAIIIVVVVGSLWIMHHLNKNMMPM